MGFSLWVNRKDLGDPSSASHWLWPWASHLILGPPLCHLVYEKFVFDLTNLSSSTFYLWNNTNKVVWIPWKERTVYVPHHNPQRVCNTQERFLTICGQYLQCVWNLQSAFYRQYFMPCSPGITIIIYRLYLCILHSLSTLASHFLLTRAWKRQKLSLVQMQGNRLSESWRNFLNVTVKLQSISVYILLPLQLFIWIFGELYILLPLFGCQHFLRKHFPKCLPQNTRP